MRSLSDVGVGLDSLYRETHRRRRRMGGSASCFDLCNSKGRGGDGDGEGARKVRRHDAPRVYTVRGVLRAETRQFIEETLQATV